MWSAGFEYDEGRLGRAAIFGLRSREEAIEWLNSSFDWKRCWFMLPSCWIRSNWATNELQSACRYVRLNQ